jgi:hypothetical protein
MQSIFRRIRNYEKKKTGNAYEGECTEEMAARSTPSFRTSVTQSNSPRQSQVLVGEEVPPYRLYGY